MWLRRGHGSRGGSEGGEGGTEGSGRGGGESREARAARASAARAASHTSHSKGITVYLTESSAQRLALLLSVKRDLHTGLYLYFQ